MVDLKIIFDNRKHFFVQYCSLLGSENQYQSCLMFDLILQQHIILFRIDRELNSIDSIAYYCFMFFATYSLFQSLLRQIHSTWNLTIRNATLWIINMSLLFFWCNSVIRTDACVFEIIDYSIRFGFIKSDKTKRLDVFPEWMLQNYFALLKATQHSQFQFEMLVL